ncbi:MAG: dihydrodipicolinate synthase family protein [Limisphaerales bacterium]
MPDYPPPPDWVIHHLRAGLVIPAHPLALDAAGRLDERRQRALTRYYHAAGAGGVAVGVHTTQFAIREPKHRLFEPVLRLASETVADLDRATGRQTVRIAGLCGPTSQARTEARLARDLGYHAGLLSLAALRSADVDALIAHCQAVAGEIPVIGFYLQPAAGGRLLPFPFWRRFVEIPNVVAIKIAPFDRYQTFEVVRAVAEAGRAADLALYTGNDDHLVLDLLTEYAVSAPDGGRAPSSYRLSDVPALDSDPASGPGMARLGMVGGLLGHWACWTHRAVELLIACRQWRHDRTIPASVLTLASQITDSNAALFDAANRFAGCLPGIHEVLRRQRLLESTRCLDPNETLSPGQAEEIDRVCAAYPHLNDDAFVQEHLDTWLNG